ncbi:MAG: NUDIX hydrolase [bacterium]|nr:NUDIX hydrolase [bacterium]
MNVVCGGIVCQDYTLLLVHNRACQTLNVPYMCPPGGKREPAESSQECVQRELFEELGILVQPKRLLGIYDMLEYPSGPQQVHTYACQWVSGVVQNKEPYKLKTVEWYNINQIFEFKESGILAKTLEAILDSPDFHKHFRGQLL